jgi:hypothetical protein
MMPQSHTSAPNNMRLHLLAVPPYPQNKLGDCGRGDGEISEQPVITTTIALSRLS